MVLTRDGGTVPRQAKHAWDAKESGHWSTCCRALDEHGGRYTRMLTGRLGGR